MSLYNWCIIFALLLLLPNSISALFCPLKIIIYCSRASIMVRLRSQYGFRQMALGFSYVNKVMPGLLSWETSYFIYLQLLLD